MYFLRFYPTVESQLSEYYLWYEEKNPGLGDKFLSAFEACTKYLQENPFGFQKRHKKYHLGLLEIFPYGIYYLVNEKEKVILIASVYHLSMNPKTIRKKLPK